MIKDIVSEIENRVYNECIKLRNKTLLVAVSGGADSVCLLRTLWSIRERLDLELLVLHCNFHLRGEESNRDMQFVEDLCSKLDVPLEIKHFDVPSYCALAHKSVEEGCRDLRYEWFAEQSKQRGYCNIALAHNADDNVETLLLNLLRGTGIGGLCAMYTSLLARFRPLLHTYRSEILQYLEAIGQDYVTDSTNLESEYRRNFLRNEVIPLIEQKWPQAKKAITTTISNLQDQRMVMQKGYSAIDKEYGCDGTFMPIELLRDKKYARTMLHRFMFEDLGTNQAVLDEILSVAAKEDHSGRIWKAGRNTLMMRHDGLYIVKYKKNPVKDADNTVLFRNEWLANTEENRAEMLACKDLKQAWFPAPMPKCRFRKAKPDDRIQPLGMKGSQTVAKIIKDAHLPPTEWDKVTVMEEVATGRILWIPGLKRSRHYLVAPEDNYMLHYTIDEQKD